MENNQFEQSQKALVLLYESILDLLKDNPNGLTNTEITNDLGLESSQDGKQKDYLAYSLLGNLMNENKIIKTKIENRVVYRLNK